MIPTDKPTDKRIALILSSSAAIALLYNKAESKILKTINKALLKGPEPAKLRDMQDQVGVISDQLLQDSYSWSQEAIPALYAAGIDGVDAELGASGVNVLEGMVQAHKTAVDVLTENMNARFEEINQFIGRQTDDIYRQLTLKHTSDVLSGSETWKQAAQALTDDLADNGVLGFVDKSGRNWDLSDYAEMATRTTVRQATNQGTRNRLQEHGHDLAQISEGSSAKTCDACEEWAGQVVSLTGDYVGDYPPVEDAEDAGCFHPNCVHILTAAIDAEEAMNSEGD